MSERVEALTYLSYCSVFEGELSDAIPVVHVSIGGCRILGTLCSGRCVCVCVKCTCAYMPPTGSHTFIQQ